MNTLLLILLAVIVTGAVVTAQADREVTRWRFWSGLLADDRDRWRRKSERLRRRLAAAECELTDLRALRDAGELSCPCLRLGGEAWLIGALEAACGELAPGEAVEALTLQARPEGQPGFALVAVTGTGCVVRSVQFGDGDGPLVDIDLPAADSPAWRSGDDGEGCSVG